MITAFLAGLVAGYGIAIPVGAVAAYLITLGAAHGFPTAAAGGLGAASVDALYAGVAVTLGALLAPLIMTVATPLRWLSALVLVGVAVRMIVLGLRPRSGSDQPPDAPSPGRAYVTVFVITLVNPATVVYFAALVGGATASFGRASEAVSLRARRRDRLGQLAAAARGRRCGPRTGADRSRPPAAGRRWWGRPSSWPSPIWTLLAP